jgi:monofunctional biosynthetic peptidoglycan transglycosylase
VVVPLDRFEATSFGRTLRNAGPVDPRSVTSIGFLLAEKTPGPFALEVAWIRVRAGDQARASQRRPGGATGPQGGIPPG